MNFLPRTVSAEDGSRTHKVFLPHGPEPVSYTHLDVYKRQDLDEEIHYAVTPGELHLVPKTIRTVIDIGNRVVDISTINEIIAFFHLPTSLADEVTRNYMSHIVQVLKLSNHQLSHSLDMKQTMQILMDNISDGICMLSLIHI